MNRLLFLVLLTFWLVMNYLLYRAEFGTDTQLGSPIPPEVVWRKILTAPDDSSLGVYQAGQRIGFCRVVANVGEETAHGKVAQETELPEGMVRAPTGFTLEIDGNVMLRLVGTNRLKFTLNATFGRDEAWRDIRVRVGVRPLNWEMRLRADDRSVRFRQETDGVETWGHTATLEDLRDPRKLALDLGGPLAASMLAGLQPTASGMGAGPSGVRAPGDGLLGLRWEARNDWLKVGRSRLRVHRLTARLLDGYAVSIVVSRVGEILRVELPQRTVMSNDALFVTPP